MISLRRYNTLGVACDAPGLVQIDSLQSLEQLGDIDWSQALLLGGGSNLVLPRALPGTAVQMAIRGIEVEAQPEGGALVTAMAGENWHALVRFSLGAGLSGLENLALIPGSVGAAPMQNIGAYGRDIADVLETVIAYNVPQREVLRLTPQECEFGYRTSRFKRESGWLILGIVLRLGVTPLDTGYPDVSRELTAQGVQPHARRLAETVIRIRRRKLPDPRLLGNVGSFFENPVVDLAQARALIEREGLSAHDAGPGRVKLSAAQMIDRCGWKGQRIGEVGVWHRQPLVLVNLGEASGAEFLNVAEQIAESVDSRFGVSLTIEPRVVRGV